jgi:hypothetical protein
VLKRCVETRERLHFERVSAVTMLAAIKTGAVLIVLVVVNSFP